MIRNILSQIESSDPNLLDLSQELVSLRTENRHFEISGKDFLEYYSNDSHIHNGTLENLFLYFDLQKHLEKKRVIFYPSFIWIIDNRKHKFFVFDNDIFLKCFDFSLIVEMKKKIIIYSTEKQSDFDKTLFIESKLKEFVYDLSKVFDQKTYFEKYKDRKQSEIKKKIYNKIVYPMRYLEKLEGFSEKDIEESDFEKVEELHKDWVNFKLNDPKVFKMMFSSNRYNRCIKTMFDIGRNNFFCKGFYLNGELIAVRQCLILGEFSYDIGFFSAFWKLPSNLVNYLNTYCLSQLHFEQGVNFHNTGMVLDKNLEMFKNHFPGEPKITYKYNLL